MKATWQDWLRGKRGQRGEPGFISQDDLARRMKVTRPFVVQLEKMDEAPTFPTRQKVHAALGTTEDELRALGIIRDASLRGTPITAHGSAKSGSFFVPDERPNYGDPLAALVASFSDEQREMFRLFLARDSRTTRTERDRFDAEDAEDAETEQDAG